MKIRHVVLSALMVLLAVPAMAQGNSIELIIGSTALDAQGGDNDDLDDTGTAYAFTFDHPLWTGRVSGTFHLERLDAFDNPELATWGVDAGARWNFGDNTTDDGDPAGLFRAYLGGTLGGVWTDTMTEEQEVEVGEETATLETDASEQFLMATITAGGRLFLNAERTFGFGGELEYGIPINGGLELEDTTAGKIFVIIPVSTGTP